MQLEKVTLSDGRIYEGEVLRTLDGATLLPHGTGSVRYVSGDQFHGMWRRGHRVDGRYVYKPNSLPYGDWSSARRYETHAQQKQQQQRDDDDDDDHSPGASPRVAGSGTKKNVTQPSAVETVKQLCRLAMPGDVAEQRARSTSAVSAGSSDLNTPTSSEITPTVADSVRFVPPSADLESALHIVSSLPRPITATTRDCFIKPRLGHSDSGGPSSPSVSVSTATPTTTSRRQ
eukprot:PhM_4_TR18869/c0_g1_i1/m.18570